MKSYEMLYGVPETYNLIAEQFTVVWECLCVHQFHFPPLSRPFAWFPILTTVEDIYFKLWLAN